MKNLNKKSDLYYINKAIVFKPFNLMKVHLVDDDCNEFIATVKGTYIPTHAYIAPSEISIIDYEEYNRTVWDAMEQYLEYERAEKF